MTEKNPLLINILALNDSPAQPEAFSTKVDSLTVTSSKEAAFEAGLDRLDIHSVFDIVRQPKTEFCRKFAELGEQDRTLKDINAELTYDHAMCYAIQIGRLYREQQTSAGQTGTLMIHTADSAKYQDLFNDKWGEFCKVGAIAAVDSPVAYLMSLRRLITETVEPEGLGTRPKIPLDARRPDLKDLIIDQQSTFTPVPMLNIVNEVLAKSIETFTKKNAAQVEHDITHKRHPFLFPYHFSHHQCQLGLSERNHSLGDIRYCISPQLPIWRDAQNGYGQHEHASAEAQVLLCGLSPGQQSLLTEPTFFSDAHVTLAGRQHANPDDLLTESQQAFFTRHYGVNVISRTQNPLIVLDTFMTQTGLDADAVEALLATRRYSPKLSPNCPSLPSPPAGTHAATKHPDAARYGAGYINGDHGADTKKENAHRTDSVLKLDDVSTAEGPVWHLDNTSLHRFDRLQRMIRLQRWMNIPYAELDTLIVAAMQAEGDANPGRALNDNTLRTLGVFRYLSQRYDIKAEEFAAFLHHLSPYTHTDRPPLFDQVFNSPVLFDTPLTLDHTEFETSSGASRDQQTVYQLCASLGLQSTQAGLERLADNTRKYVGPLRRSLATVSSLYRQARIARMFGLSAQDNWALVDLLGGNAYHQAVARGALRTEGDGPDILDILMQMDWAVTWLKQSRQEIASVRAHIGLEPGTLIATQTLIDQLKQLHQQMNQSLITGPQVHNLNLPNSVSTPIDWMAELKRTLIDDKGLVRALPLQRVDDVKTQLDEALIELIQSLPLEPDEKIEARTSLCKCLLAAHDSQLHLIERLLQELTELHMDWAQVVIHWAGSSTQALLTQLDEAITRQRFTEEHFDPKLLGVLQTLVRHAHMASTLDLSELTLRLFLVSPSWLGAPMVNSSPALASFYLLERYSHLVHEAEVQDAELLNYLSLANTPQDPPVDVDILVTELAQLLRWSKSELFTLVQTLPDDKAVTLAQVDWLYRCKQTCQTTGLTADSLQRAVTLNAQSPASEWQAMGNAAMAASR